MRERKKKTRQVKEEKQVKGTSNMLFGIVLSSLALGALYSIQFIKFGFFIFLFGSLAATVYIMESLGAQFRNQKQTRANAMIGVISAILIMLSLGMQSRQLPLKIYILGIGILVFLWGLIQFVRSK